MYVKLFFKTAGLLTVVFFSSIFAGAFFAASFFKDFASEKTQCFETIVEIPYGSPLRYIAKLLAEKGVISDARKFYWYLRLGRDDGTKMQAGYYNFVGSFSNKEIADRLLFGRDKSIKIVFKEGETLVDLAKKLEDAAIANKQQFINAMNSSESLQKITWPHAKNRRSLKNAVGGLEGYLFPDTYYFTKKDSAKSVIKKMHQRLREMLTADILERIDEKNMSLHEVLTIASIIEKETGEKSERAIISSVYQNRLKLGMRLQADPTVIYGMKDYQGKIGKSDLLTFHSYNTYQIAGLPPGPIAACGIDSIKAVLWPLATNYLYFVSKNDGTHVFCENLSCHNEAVKKWQIDFFRKAAREN